MTGKDLYKLTILGCGTSGGVPRIGGHWGACNPRDPRNSRRRCSLLVQRFGPDGVTSVLVDTSPDLRAQLLDAGVGELDGVLYTHEHADHTHGIDELRVVAANCGERIKTYMDARTADILMSRFDYCFIQPPGSLYRPILEPHVIAPGQPVTIEGAGGPVKAVPFNVVHGRIIALGYRFGTAAYTSDLNGIPDDTIPFLSDLDLWIVDGFRHTPRHSTHFTLEDALHWIWRLKPKHAVITNMHVDLDYDELAAFLPDGVEPAFDGMQLDVAVTTPGTLLTV